MKYYQKFGDYLHLDDIAQCTVDIADSSGVGNQHRMKSYIETSWARIFPAVVSFDKVDERTFQCRRGKCLATTARAELMAAVPNRAEPAPIDKLTPYPTV